MVEVCRLVVEVAGRVTVVVAEVNTTYLVLAIHHHHHHHQQQHCCHRHHRHLCNHILITHSRPSSNTGSVV